MFDQSMQTGGDEQDMGASGTSGVPPQGSTPSASPFSPPSGASAPAAPQDAFADPSQPGIAPTQAAPQIEVGSMRTMPEKFMSGGHVSTTMVRGGSSRRRFMIIAVVVVLLGAITAGAYFYLQMPDNIFTGKRPEPAVGDGAQAPDDTAPPGPTDTGPENPDAVPATPEEQEVMKSRDAQRVQDLQTIAGALSTYFERFESYPQFLSVIPRDILADAPTDPKTSAPYTYTATEGRQSYRIIFDVEYEATLKGQKMLAGSWEVYPSDFQAPDGTDEVVPPDGTEVPPEARGSVDADGDGLTALEEGIFRTSLSVQDTDSDGYNDATEIKNFYSPIQSGAITLSDTDLIELYMDPVRGFGFYYPTEWAVRVPATNANDIVISAPTGEDFTVTVADNAQQQTSWEWYVERVSQDYNPDNVDIVTVAGVEAVRSLDGLSVYVALDDMVLSIVYHQNEVQTVNYPAIFQLLLDRITLL